MQAWPRHASCARPPQASFVVDRAVQNAIPAGQSNVLAKTALVRELGGFDEHLSMIADWEMWIRLAAAGTPQPCPDVHVAWVIHDTNMHLGSTGARAPSSNTWPVSISATRRPEEGRRSSRRSGAPTAIAAPVSARRLAKRIPPGGLAQRSPGMVLRGVVRAASPGGWESEQAQPELPGGRATWPGSMTCSAQTAFAVGDDFVFGAPLIGEDDRRVSSTPLRSGWIGDGPEGGAARADARGVRRGGARAVSPRARPP